MVRRDRGGTWLLGLVLVALLGGCEVGSTDVAGGATAPAQTAPTGPTQEATGPTAITGPTGSAVLEGTWTGTWGFPQLPDAGTFSMEIVPTQEGFSGTIQIDESECVSNGTLTIGLEGDRIEIGAIQAEEAITFSGTISGDRMSGTWNDGGSCPPPHDGIWEAVRS